jgi:hypothetical protein
MWPGWTGLLHSNASGEIFGPVVCVLPGYNSGLGPRLVVIVNGHGQCAGMENVNIRCALMRA